MRRQLILMCSLFLCSAAPAGAASDSSQARVLLGSGGTNAGGSESVEADAFTGTTTYAVTIPLPPARGAIAPKLKLNYNSHRKNPNSWVGLGWELDVGSIQRLPEEGVINFVAGARFEARFGGQAETIECDSADRDIALADYGVSPAGGVKGDRCRARIEGAFTIYLHLYEDHPGQTRIDLGWVAIDKGGIRYEYGRAQRATEGSADKITRWFLSSITDTNGNRATIDYGLDRFPDFIRYEGQNVVVAFTKRYAGGTGLHYYPSFKQSALARDQMGVQLQDIFIFADGQRLQRYAFGYRESRYLKTQQLISITQYGTTDGVSLPPTAFDYYEGDQIAFGTPERVYSAGRQTNFGDNAGSLNERTAYVDMNGDGLVDQVMGFAGSDTFKVYYNDGNDFVERAGRSDWSDPLASMCTTDNQCQGKLTATESGYQWVQLIDMNGDALPDRVMRSNSPHAPHPVVFVIAFNDGTSWSPAFAQWNDPYQGDWAGTTGESAGLIDMNSDGLVDRIIGSSSEHLFRVYFNTGNGFRSDAVVWNDPLAVGTPSNGGVGKIRFQDEARRWFSDIRDMNGDGLPDRVYGARVHLLQPGGGTSVEIGFAVDLNRAGADWARPAIDPVTNFTLINGIDNLGIIDPIRHTASQGLLTSQSDWLDATGDGFLDRIEGDPASGEFRIYPYIGMTWDEQIIRLGAPIVLHDPVADLSGDRSQAKGLVSAAHAAGIHTFLRDMNGDGFPDRVTLNHRDESPAARGSLYVYPLQVDSLRFSDVRNFLDPEVSQPIGFLKRIDDGRGKVTEMEYISSTHGIDSTAIKHQFLPFQLYVPKNIFVRDWTIPAGVQGASIEEQRHPGFRRTSYEFSGGNYYVRLSGGPLAQAGGEFFAAFNGFQQSTQVSWPAAGESIPPITKTTFFKQARGDIHPHDVHQQPFDQFGYDHYAFSGRPYRYMLREGSQRVVEESYEWEVNRAGQVDRFNCQGACFPKMTAETREMWEPSGTSGILTRQSRSEYDYDPFGNRRKRVLKDAANNILLTESFDYHPPSRFDPTLQIRNRVAVEEKQRAGTVSRKSEYDYDLRGNRRLEKVLVDEGPPEKVETQTRDFYPDGNVRSITGRDGITRELDYDPTNAIFPIVERTLMGANQPPLVTRREFHRLTGEVTRETLPQGHGVRKAFDDFGRQREEYLVESNGTEHLSKRFEYSYLTQELNGWQGIVLQKIDAYDIQEGHVSTQTTPASIAYRDGEGRTVQQCVRAPNGDSRRTLTRIADAGRMEMTTTPVFSSDCALVSAIPTGTNLAATTKDILGRIIQSIPPQGDAGSPTEPTVFTYQINPARRMVKTTTTPGNQVTVETFDEQERLVALTDAHGAVTNYTYNPVGDLRTVRVAGQLLLTIDYDLLGRKTSMTDANMGTWRYVYDPFGRLDSQQDNKGQEIHYHYTTLGRVERKEIYDAAHALEKTESYSYDQGDAGHSVLPGELFKIDELSGQGQLTRRVRFSYEANFRRVNVVTRTIPNVGDFVERKRYDVRGFLKEADYPGGERLFQTYNLAGGLEKVCSARACAGSQNIVYYELTPADSFDEYGAVTRERFGNGVENQLVYYPGSHRLHTKRSNRGVEIYADKTYTYDALANIRRIDDNLHGSQGPHSASLFRIHFDDLNRLRTYQLPTAAAPDEVEYDALGNITKNTAAFGQTLYEYTSPRPHAVTQIGSESFSYDANGNMTADPHRQRLVYNAQNQLSRVEMKNGSVAEYDYDSSGGRVQKRTSRTDPYHQTTTAVTHYVGDAIELRGDEVLFHVMAGTSRIATKNLGPLASLPPTASGTLLSGGHFLSGDALAIAQYLLGLIALLLFIQLVARPLRLGTVPVFGDCPQKGAIAEAAWGLSPCLGTVPRRRRQLALLLILSIALHPMPLFAGDTGTPQPNSNDPRYFFYLHGDHLGSSQILTEGKDSSQHAGIIYRRGDLLQRFEYAPFGQERYALNPNLEFDPSFTGQAYDIETGLYYFKARYYNPLLGRFIQPDTVIPDVKDPQSYNRYSYVLNNPLKYVDPSGNTSDPVSKDAVDEAIDQAGEGLNDRVEKLKTEGLATTPDIVSSGETPSVWERAGEKIKEFVGEVGRGVNAFFEAIVIGPKLELSRTEQLAFDFATMSGGIKSVRSIAGALEVVAARGAKALPEKAYHYTFSKTAERISQKGLQSESFLTPRGDLSPLQAHLDLALSRNRGLRDALFEIDISSAGKAGYEFSPLNQIGRSQNLPGGSFEFQNLQDIPPEFLRRIR